MSQGERISLVYADRIVAHLIKLLGDQHGLEAVGSIRRRQVAVGDVEMIAPHEPEADDKLFAALARHFYDPATAAKPLSLFAPAPERGDRIGQDLRGLKPGFKAASLVIECQKPARRSVALQVFRYDAGPAGNRGWIEMIRTGDAEFAKAMVTRWQHVRRKPWDQGSKDGYPIDLEGKPIAVPTEEAVFQLLRLPFIPPAERPQAISMVLDFRSIT